MQALKLREHVKDGQIIRTIPKEFGPMVEIILLAPLQDEIEFWQEDEIQNLGKTRTLSKGNDSAEVAIGIGAAASMVTIGSSNLLMQGRQIGLDKDFIHISDDFNAPLEEFKEYMP